MEPAYQNGSINFVNATAYLLHEPRRGDVVGIAMAGRRVMLLKRIIGLPGETVAFLWGTLIINGRKIPEPYIKTDCQWTMEEVKNGPGEYFVAGDNTLSTKINSVMVAVLKEATTLAKEANRKTVMPEDITQAYKKHVGKEHLTWEEVLKQILRQPPADLGKIPKGINDYIEKNSG